MGLTSPPPIWTMSTNILFVFFEVTPKGEALNCDVGLALGGGVVGQALGDVVGQAPTTKCH